MSLFLLIWLVIATLAANLFAVVPKDILLWWKKAVYYVVVAPWLAVAFVSYQLSKCGDWFEPVSRWFKS